MVQTQAGAEIHLQHGSLVTGASMHKWVTVHGRWMVHIRQWDSPDRTRHTKNCIQQQQWSGDCMAIAKSCFYKQKVFAVKFCNTYKTLDN